MENDTKTDLTGLTRREVLKATSLASLAAAFHTTGGAFAAYASERIRVGLIGCGGRGTGAAIDCAKASPDVVITALGDLFPDQIAWAKGELSKQLPADRVTATPETSFSGFDAFKKVVATDCDLGDPGCTPVLPSGPPRGRDRGGQARVHREAGGRGPGRGALGNRHLRARREEGPGDRGGHAAAAPGALRRDHEPRDAPGTSARSSPARPTGTWARSGSSGPPRTGPTAPRRSGRTWSGRCGTGCSRPGPPATTSSSSTSTTSTS